MSMKTPTEIPTAKRNNNQNMYHNFDQNNPRGNFNQNSNFKRNFNQNSNFNRNFNLGIRVIHQDMHLENVISK